MLLFVPGREHRGRRFDNLPLCYGFRQDDVDYAISQISTHNTNYSYDANNRLLQENEYIGGTSSSYSGFIEIQKSYGYDANGNLLKVETGGQIDSEVVEYTYNPLNQLTGYTDKNGAVTSYAYDGTGMRVSKSSDGISTRFYWDRGYISNEAENGNLTASNYIGVQGIFARKQGDTIDYMLKNGHGDVVSLVSGGAVIKTYDYDAYGVEKNIDKNDTNPFRYCGEYTDLSSGLIYLRARYYDPQVGRFISEDPIRDGFNWYVYAKNNPIRYTDPLGLAAGDPFNTIDDAAVDFGQEYYSTSDYIMLELATLIYSYDDEDGNTRYSYVKPVIGDPHSVQPLDVQGDLPDGSTRVAGIHQHPNSTEFSSADKNWAQHSSIDMPIYVVVPGNTLKVWENSGTVDGAGNAIWSERTVSSDLQLRGLSIAEKIALTYTYKSRWDTHTGTSCGFGCADKTWPRTKSGIAESWNVDDSSDFMKNWITSVLNKRYKQ